jgi:hypothetical protein
VESFYVTPVARLPFLLGRFSGGVLCALLVGLAGLLGTLSGTFMPWLDQSRIAPFAWMPYALSFGAIVVPSLLVFCAFSFSVAALSRSTTLSFAVAIGFVVLALIVNNLAANNGPAWLTLLDPFAALAVETTSRHWSVAELNTRLPLALVPENRLLWLGLALVTLVCTCRQVRLELPVTRSRAARPRTRQPESRPQEQAVACRSSFGWTDNRAQLIAQVRIDLRAVFLSPLSAIVLLLVVGETISEASGVTSALLNLPLRPQTALMLGFFRYGLFQFG